jgi:hypothetical protein
MRRTIRITGLLATSLAGLLLLSSPAFGWGESSPRAIGMGGAYTALARNIEAPYWNPANLGLSNGNGLSLNIANAGVDLKNNSFSLSDYNKYNGQFLNDDDKENIMSSIPGDGLSLDLLAEVSALNFSIAGFALTCKGYGASNANMDRDPIELLFYGNAVMREVSLAGTRSEAFGIIDVAASYGRPLLTWQGGEFAAGASLHYLRGLAYEKVVESEGGVVTTDSGFVGSGTLRMVTAMGGHGLAADIGLAVRFEENWYFSAAWQNLYSKMSWNHDNEEHLFMFDMEPVTVEAMADSALSDSLVTSSDTSYAIGSFSSNMPPVIKLGLAREYDKMTWSVDWIQGLADRPGQGVNPRIAGGFEYRPLRFLPLRTGFGFGGGQGSVYSFGFGLHFVPFNFDLGLASFGTPWPASTKGLKLGVGMGLYF